MANNTLEVSLALKAQGFRAELNNIKKDNQLLRAEFDRLASSVDDFEDTIEGKQAKLKLVRKEYENVKKMLEVYKQQVTLAKKAVEESNSELQRQQSVIDSTKAYIDRYKDATGDVAISVQQAKDRLEQLEKEFQKQAKAVTSANTHYQNMQIHLANTEKKANELGNELLNCREDMDNFANGVTQAEKELKDLEDEMEKAKKRSEEFARNMSEIGQGLIDVGDKMGEFGQKGLSVLESLVEKGSELNASTAQTEMVYGNLGSSVQKAIDSQSELASTYGLTERQMKSATTEIASYYKAMGFTDDAIADLLPSQAQLIADLSAFGDIPFEDALGDYKSALMGNHEAVDKYNIAIGESTINESEYAKSIGKTLSQMTEQEKIQARTNVMMEQSADYTGLAAQESEEFTAKAKLLKTQLSEAAGTIGETLLPALTPLIENVSKIVEKVVAWVEENPELTATILGVVGVVSTLLAVLSPIITTVGMVIISFGAIQGAIMGAGGAMAFLTTTILPVVGVIAGVIAIAFILYNSIKSNFDGIKEATTSLIEKCKPYFEELRQSFSDLWSVCQSIYDTIIAPLFKMIGEVIEVAITFATPFFIAFANVFSEVINKVVNIWNSIGQPLMSTIMFVIQSVFDFVKPIFILIGEAFTAMIEVFLSVYNNTLSPLIESFISIIGGLLDKVRPTFDSIKESIVNALDTVNKAIDGAISWIRDLLNTINGALGKVGEFLSGLNPFKSKSIDVEATMNANLPKMNALDVPINPIGDIALSGSYYNSNTPLSTSMAKLGSVASGLSNNGGSTVIKQDNSQIESILEKYLSQFVQAMASFNPSIEVGLNGRKLSEEINVINGQGLKLNERWR